MCHDALPITRLRSHIDDAKEVRRCSLPLSWAFDRQGSLLEPASKLYLVLPYHHVTEREESK